MSDEDRPHFICPQCGRISYHPDDIANSYCGACHESAPQSISESDSPEVSLIRLAFELGQMSAQLKAAAEASRARTAELRTLNQRLRKRLGLDDDQTDGFGGPTDDGLGYA